MSGLDKFETVSTSELSKVVGGDNASYNFGYEVGRDIRRWYRHHFK